MNEFPKLEEKYENFILNIISKKNLDIKEQKDLNFLFSEFYKKFGTFSIFEEAKNPKFQIAIAKIKKEELENKKKSLFRGNKSLFKSDIEKEIFHKGTISKENGVNPSVTFPELWETDLRILADKLEKLRKNEIDFIRDQTKKWEQKKENDNIKFANNDEATKKKEEKMKQFFINLTIQENSFPNESFIKFLSILKQKKQKKYEKDPYVMDYKINMHTVNSSSYSWEPAEDGEKEETDDLTNFNLLQNKSLLNNIIKMNNTIVTKNDHKILNHSSIKKKNKDNSQMETKNHKEKSYLDSKAWKNFENDLTRFIKEQEV